MSRVAVRLSSPFSPTDIPNMVFHVDAQSGVYVDAGMTLATDGQTAERWNDASGQANHLSQAGAPTYRATGFASQPGVEFSDWASMVSPAFLDSTYDTAITAFYIGEADAGQRVALSVGDVAFAAGELNEWNRFDVSGLGIPTAVYHGAQTLAGNLRCVGMSYDGSTLRTIINGHLIKRARTGDLGLTGALTIGDYSTINHWWHGNIAEVYVWRYGATDVQMRRMCGYLLSRWGLALPTPRRSICYVGDSQTAYQGVTMWPGLIAANLGTLAQSHTTVAQGGVSLAFIASIAAGWVDPMIDSSQALQINIIWAGTNDLAQGVSAAEVYAWLASYCTARRAAGWHKIIVVTALPRSADGDDESYETHRQEFNGLVRTNYATIADGLADVAADARIGDAGDELDTTYFYADRVHLNSAGQAIVAAIMQPAIESML